MPKAVLQDSDCSTHTPGEKGARVPLAGKQAMGQEFEGIQSSFLREEKWNLKMFLYVIDMTYNCICFHSTGDIICLQIVCWSVRT